MICEKQIWYKMVKDSEPEEEKNRKEIMFEQRL